MTEKLESETSRGVSISGRLSVHRQSRSSQMDCPITDERLPMLHNSKSSSVCSSGPLSINSDSQDSINLTLDESENATYVSPGDCGKDCLTYSSICHGVSCKKMFCDRFPKGRAVFIVLLINGLESFVVFGAFDGLKERIMGRHSDGIHLGYLFVFFQWCGGRIFYPITGLIADTCLGRYKMIKIGLWLMWLGFVIITVNESLVYHYANNDSLDHTVERYILPIIAVILLIISSGTVEANIIPFGVDQIQQGASSSEMSSYFYYYYFSRIAGLLIGLILFILLFSTGIKLFPDFTNPDSEKTYTSYTLHAIHPLFAVLSVTVALISHFCSSQQYFKDRDYSNPLRLIINVLYYAATVKRQPPRYRRAFRYGEERKSRIELAKMEYDGIFTSEEVEDVKTFFRICLLIFSLSGNFLTIGMSLNILQEELAAASYPLLKSYLLAPEIFQVIFFTVSLISVLTMNHLIIPLFPGFRMKLKIGTGVMFSAFAPASALIIQLVITKDDFSCDEGFSCHQPTHLLWLILPVIFASIGLMHIFTAGLEFMYAQSPNSMKGLLTGFFFLWYGIFNGAGIIFYGNFVANHDDKTRRGVIYNVVATCIGVLSVILYMVVAYIYKNRMRPTDRDDIEDDAVRRGMYGNVSTLNFPDRGN